MNGSVFISYSHLDQGLMQAFKKHLDGMLMDRCTVWTDEDIPPGTTWEETLLGNLRQATAALVLASPDYLVSPWCRAELKSLAAARRGGQIRLVYWVLLRPCGWKWSELAELQAVQEPADRALSDALEGAERDAKLLRSCERIAAGVLGSLDDEDAVVTAVRNLLRNSEQAAHITPMSKLSGGDFSIVCRGRQSNGDDVVIKVLTSTPLHCMRDLYFDVNRACRTVQSPFVLRIKEVFSVGKDYEQRIVILTDLARGTSLAKALADDADAARAERHFTLDRVGSLLVRIAEALQALHGLAPFAWPGGDPYTHLMGPLVPSNIYYDTHTGRPLLSLTGVANFLWQFFEPEAVARIAGPRMGNYRLPEKMRNATVDKRADQYFLGMLALELLEGRPLFAARDGEPAVDSPLDYLRTRADHRWTLRHEQLRGIVAKLLADDPAERYPDMDDVVATLHALEDSSRALAKYSYRRYVAAGTAGAAPDHAFSQSFYDAFFLRDPAALEVFERAHGQRPGPIPGVMHHAKLTDAIKSILNFRSGGAPSSIDSVAAAHLVHGDIEPHFDTFEQSFLHTLRQRVEDGGPGADAAADRADIDDIVQAWQTLFRPVRDEMIAAIRNAPRRVVRHAGVGGT